MSLFEKIAVCPAVPGKNERMTNLLRDEFACFGCKENTDGMGNVFFSKDFGEGKHVMLCSSIDVGGVIATYIEGSKIYVGALGKSDMMQIAFSKVVFEGATGVLVAPDAYNSGTALTDCYVETYDKNVSDKVQQGDKGYFDIPLNTLENGAYWGYGAGERYALYTNVKATAKLFGEDGGDILKKYGIGKVTAAFLSQGSLMSRGALTACYGKNPDKVILFSAKKSTDGVTPEDKYIIKLHDRAFSADGELTSEICAYLDENGISYKKTVEGDGDTALASLSQAVSCPDCASICVPVFHNRVIVR